MARILKPQKKGSSSSSSSNSTTTSKAPSSSSSKAKKPSSNKASSSSSSRSKATKSRSSDPDAPPLVDAQARKDALAAMRRARADKKAAQGQQAHEDGQGPVASGSGT